MADIFQEQAKRSFEALAAYRPESLQVVDQHHREIINKILCFSQDDKLETMNSYSSSMLPISKG